MNTELSTRPAFRPSLALFHANTKGTGSALRVSLRPASSEKDGAIFLSIAPQLTIGDRSHPVPILPSFDFESPLCFRLDFVEVSQLLQVLLGEVESVEEGKGLYHVRRVNGKATTKRFTFRHLIEPYSCYELNIFESGDGVEDRSAVFSLKPAESLGLAECLTAVLPVIAFGDFHR